MANRIDPREHYRQTLASVGYTPLNDTPTETYRELGFMSGLEVHQQLNTREKLFCRCPAGHFHPFERYDAEIVRHMRPTLSELGEYAGPALMQFKTRKEIIYRIKYETACTYEFDDTPPFPINREALAYAIEIALLTRMNIVGELHITRKQYLDGSIPTGFQRTGIVGIEGGFPIPGKNIRVIQLSIEEDSCREVSDIRHRRVYSTDRLGMPLIETVTYPDMLTPWEVRDAAHMIRFLARSSGRVRVGMGAAREDVNVSITGGTRVEIKGVAHIAWIPRLTHIEAFRQKALLMIRDELQRRRPDAADWKPATATVNAELELKDVPGVAFALENGYRFTVMKLPDFRGLLAHFTQPGKTFQNELADRLKVIACVERPNLFTEEDLDPVIPETFWAAQRKALSAGDNDVLVLLPTPEEDAATAIDTVSERCLLAWKGIPGETRKSTPNGTTLFERVLPGPDRMYPDTDSAPIPIAETLIEQCRGHLPVPVQERIDRLTEWGAPPDTYAYILRNDLMPLIERIVATLPFSPDYVVTVLAHQLKRLEGRYGFTGFCYEQVFDMFNFIHKRGLDPAILKAMLPISYQNPKMEFNSILIQLHYEKADRERILSLAPSLNQMFADICRTKREEANIEWIMGNLRKLALGNIDFAELREAVKDTIAERTVQ